jgi:hypothetical protein
MKTFSGIRNDLRSGVPVDPDFLIEKMREASESKRESLFG